MVNDSKRIGFIGREPECYTGCSFDAVLILKCLELNFSFVNVCHFVLIRYLPRSVGMKRIALHKSISARGDKMYLLVCECSELLTEISSAAVLIPTIRARLCGYTGLYRPIQAF